MDIQDIVNQCASDTRYWFPQKAGDHAFTVLAMAGEVGELANLVKKVERGTHTLEQVRGQVAEEAIDVFIYLMNLFYDLGVDVETLYQHKRDKNAERFGRMEMGKSSISRYSYPMGDYVGD